MQIHRLLVSVNQIDHLNNGAVLAFEKDVGLLDEGDALVARMSDGGEQLLIVRQAYPQSWTASHQAGTVAQDVRLEQVDARHLRVIVPA